ncbi:restriction endonuclease fold toxin-2 domain-containing protein [Streptomyces sp. NPDC048018]|uniref:restriction endonuclease fold toxin-2 domain-containing protein n=1 Tax=Streptomyces sp. NPDC048018 TaxID=3365499 RepID=UPI003710A081
MAGCLQRCSPAIGSRPGALPTPPIRRPRPPYRGLEIVTNGKDGAASWQSMMAMTGTTGSTRYVP